MRISPRAEIDRALEELRSGGEAWKGRPLSERVALLAVLRARADSLAKEWVRAACGVKRIAFDSPAAAEEWIAGPMIFLRYLRLLERTLRETGVRGRPPLPRVALRPHPGGGTAVRVFPIEGSDPILYRGFRAEVRSPAGINLDRFAAAMAMPNASGAGSSPRIALVLGAGNVTCIAPLDVVQRLFVLDQVVLLKVHPALEAVGPVLERLFQGLTREGFLRIVFGGAEEGAYLAEHPLVDEIHLTGSDRTHDTMVWGASESERAERKRTGRPRLAKPITSELGCVTPIFVVPGTWTRSEIGFQAENIASMVANNAAANCNAARLLVTASGWPQREEFLAALRSAFARIPTRVAWYPGSAEKYRSLLAGRAKVETIGSAEAGRLPWTLVTGLDPAASEEPLFRTEAWSPILAETRLAIDGAEKFLERAVDFANQRLWGTLCAAILIDPRTRRAHQDAVDRATDRLRYGTVAVNLWPAVGFALGVTPWGAYPGHTFEEIGSGRGWVHNALLLPEIEKAVVEGPFVARPRPAWFATHRNALPLARRLVAFEARPSLAKIPGIVLAALRG